MSPVNSMFVCIKKKIYIYILLSANLFLKRPISIIGKMLNIDADNRSTPSLCHSLTEMQNMQDSYLKCFCGLIFIDTSP